MTVTANKGFLALIGVAVVLALAGCGKKSSPDQPSGAVYPSTYPDTGPESKPQDQPEKTKDGKTYSPLGFPLEYPNRPTY